MDNYILLAIVSFLTGVVSSYLFWKWRHSVAIKVKVSELLASKITKTFNLGGGVTYYRPRRLGISQEGSESNLHGISELNLIEHDGYIEIFGAWNRNKKNQIDPYTICFPTSSKTIQPDRIIEFGQYFVDLGEKLNTELENA